MPNLVKLTIDGKRIEAAAGTLVIEAARRAGVEVPSFCYYTGLSLQGACRMCVVDVEKAPKLMTACTLPVSEGMVVRTETPQVAQARKATLEFLLTNHPLDCPVCDKGGECELQDMAFRYGIGDSRFLEAKYHVPEKQWSPVVYYDAPRCILCFRCVRICNEGMGVNALGIVNRGVTSEIAPNHGDHLLCDECGMCIDICPVGALTSGAYRYKTRPWEMEHVGTICTHCSDGCKTTLGVRNSQIIRANNRDSSGINGEFLCIKGRYAFDFSHHPERLQSPLMRINGRLEPVAWSKALAHVAERFKEVKSRNGKFAVIGSTRTTNEENYYLQKLARQGLGTNHIDHRRSGDLITLLDALAGAGGTLATAADLYNTKAVLVAGSDLALEHPFLSFQIRANWRHHQAHVYVVSEQPVREDKYAAAVVRIEPGGELAGIESLREPLAKESELAIVFGPSIRGAAVRKLVAFGVSLGIPVKYVCLVDYSNSRGAMDMGLVPELLPGYRRNPEPGMRLPEILACEDLDVLWVVGANPLEHATLTARNALVVVQEMFLTETSRAADVVLPASSAYEKSGTVTNVTGDVQRLKKGLEFIGAKPDLEIFGLIAREMGLAAAIGPWIPEKVFEEIGKIQPLRERLNAPDRSELVCSSRDGLFTSGTLGRFCSVLTSVLEARLP